MDSVQLKRVALKIAFAVWVGLWLFFAARELFIKDNIRDYRALIGRSLEGKRAYVTGERLYGFLGFCKANLPQSATYGLIGVEESSLEKRRAVYYLYPLLENKDPDFVLVYGGAATRKDGYAVFAESVGSGYIMKRER